MLPLGYMWKIAHQACWPEVCKCIAQDSFTVSIYGHTAEHTRPWTKTKATASAVFAKHLRWLLYMLYHPIDDLLAMRRMTDSSSVNLLFASERAAVRRESCVLQSASTCAKP